MVTVERFMTDLNLDDHSAQQRLVVCKIASNYICDNNIQDCIKKQQQ